MKRKGLCLILMLTGIAGLALGDGLKRERGKPNDAAKDAVEGKPAPELKVTDWINTPDAKGLELTALKGKVVIIDFWGTW